MPPGALVSLLLYSRQAAARNDDVDIRDCSPPRPAISRLYLATCDPRKQSSAVMAETNAENPRLSPQRPLGTFHLLGDLGKRRPRFRVRLELAHVLLGPRSAMG